MGKGLEIRVAYSVPLRVEIDEAADIAVELYLDHIGSPVTSDKELQRGRTNIEGLTRSQLREVRRYLFDQGWEYLSKHVMNTGLKHITGSIDNSVYYSAAMTCHAAAKYLSREFIGEVTHTRMPSVTTREVDRNFRLIQRNY